MNIREVILPRALFFVAAFFMFASLVHRSARLGESVAGWSRLRRNPGFCGRHPPGLRRKRLHPCYDTWP